MKVWAVANQKGGVGKTTTAVSLASLLAAGGRSTLLVDLDPHASATGYLLGAGARHGGSTSIFDQAAAGEPIRPDELVDATAQERLAMLAATPALAAMERRYATRAGMGGVLATGLKAFQHDFEHVILDCPPTLGLLMVNALAASGTVLIPVQTEHLALEGLRRMLATLIMIERSQRRTIDRLIIPTLFDRRTRAAHQTLEVLRAEHAAVLWDDVIPIDTRLRDAARAGQPGPLYSPGGRAVTAYRRLLAAVAPELVVEEAWSGQARVPALEQRMLAT